jgi:hypothetical protein
MPEVIAGFEDVFAAGGTSGNRTVQRNTSVTVDAFEFKMFGHVFYSIKRKAILTIRSPSIVPYDLWGQDRDFG